MFWIQKPKAASHISQLFCCLKSGCETLFTLCWTPARGGLVLADGRGAEARRFLLRPDEALIAPLPGTALMPSAATEAGEEALLTEKLWRVHEAAPGAKAFVEKRVLKWCSEVVELSARRWAGEGLEFWPRGTGVLKPDGHKPVAKRCDYFDLWQGTPLSCEGESWKKVQMEGFTVMWVYLSAL